MAKSAKDDAKIINVYAESLFEITEANYKGIKNTLDNLLQLYNTSEELKKLVHNKFLKKNIVENTIKEILNKLNAEKYLINFINLLIKNSRLNYLPQIIERYNEIIEQKENKFRLKLIFAKQPSQELINKVVNKLETKLNKKLITEIKIDPEILDGLVVQINSTLYDASLYNKLKSFKQSVYKEFSNLTS
ncbi:MAG: ATP synthase F1 subunit delta [Sphingobacteriia bacterium]|nr:ATP synthase F1 subunit delta [Sphingobacteriia bacterium]